MSKLPKLLLSILLITALSGPVFAQGTDIMPAGESDYWNQKIDPTTGWGKWIMETVKPYWEELSETMKKYILAATEIDMTGLSPEEIIKQVNLQYTNYYNAIKEMSPPPELKAYHEKIVAIYGETSNMVTYDPQQQELIVKLGMEANQELARVFMQHGVPQNVIDDFIKNPLQ